MNLVQAKASDFEKAREFYHSLIDEMKQAGNIITWVKDVYPSPEFLRATAEKGELYFGMEGDEVAAAMVLNHDANEAYRQTQWPTPASEDEVMVIHALGVHPRFGGKSLGARMVEEAIAIARESGIKAIRLDVLEGNEPARRIYLACGFESITSVQMFYENTGLANFELFELAL